MLCLKRTDDFLSVELLLNSKGSCCGFCCFFLHLRHVLWKKMFLQKRNCHYFLYSFTLYSAYTRISRKRLVLRHSASHFSLNSGGIACWVTQLNTALSLDTRKKKLKIWNISFPRVGIEPTTCHVYSHPARPWATTGLTNYRWHYLMFSTHKSVIIIMKCFTWLSYASLFLATLSSTY